MDETRAYREYHYISIIIETAYCRWTVEVADFSLLSFSFLNFSVLNFSVPSCQFSHTWVRYGIIFLCYEAVCKVLDYQTTTLCSFAAHHGKYQVESITKHDVPCSRKWTSNCFLKVYILNCMIVRTQRYAVGIPLSSFAAW